MTELRVSECVEWLKGQIHLAECVNGDSSPYESCLFHLSAQQEAIEDIVENIHYPDCWDTAAYPTLHDALIEVSAFVGCDPACCTHPQRRASDD